MRCRAAGCSKVFEEKASGAQRERPALKAALDYMREGDTLVVWKLDRLARSLKQLIETVEKFGERGIGLRSLTEAIDTTTAGGKLMFHIFAALAEFERGVIRERTLAGLQAARARGRTGGRPPALEAKDLAAAKALLQDPEITVVRGRQTPGRGGLDPLSPSAQGPHSGPGSLASSAAMPIKPELRFFYPIDWPQISHWVRFVRAGGKCQVCGRPHGAIVQTWAMAAGGMSNSRPAHRGNPAGPRHHPLFLAALDQTIVATAMPTIGRELRDLERTLDLPAGLSRARARAHSQWDGLGAHSFHGGAW